jgi:DNA-binding transcriptional MerR regulator
MLINKVAEITGFTRDTIRYYEKIGLITLTSNERVENNYRMFDKKTVTKLVQIGKLKEFGFTLNEMKLLFETDEAGTITCRSVLELVNNKIITINNKISELVNVKERLIAGKALCKGDCKKIISATGSR